MSSTARHVGQALVIVSTLVALALSFVDGSVAAQTSTGAGQIRSAGTKHTCALTPDGAGPCWGNNGARQASKQHGLVEWNGSPVPPEPEPTQVPELTPEPEPTDLPPEPTEQSPEPTNLPPEPSVLPGPTAPPEGCCAP